MKYPQYKYEFEIDGQTVLMAVGESMTLDNGVTVKVHRFSKSDLMYNLSITLDGGVWIPLENGYRTVGGKLRADFKKFKMVYPSVSGNRGTKLEEIKLCPEV